MTDDEREELEQLREERWQVVAMRNGALNRAEAAEAALAKLRDKVVVYRKACNDDLNRRWDHTDHGGRLACDYVLQELDAIKKWGD